MRLIRATAVFATMIGASLAFGPASATPLSSGSQAASQADQQSLVIAVQHGRHGGGMRHGGGGHQRMSRETLEGPPSPAILHDSIGLSGEQLQLYARRYSNYTAETGPVRDSLRTSMQAMRAAFESGDRSEARSRHDALERQSQELTKRDKEFEKVLKEGLTKDQQKRYDKWKDARDKAEREQHQHLRRPTPGGNP